MKRWVLIILRLLIAAAGIAYILYAITWRDTVIDGQTHPGVLTILQQARWHLLIGGLLLVGLLPPGQTLRWWLLMRCQGMNVGYARAFRLNLLGLFFNFCLPGMTGGDVVRAYYAAAGSGKRGAAVMSIVFDRGIGFVALFLLAGLAGLTMLDHDLARRVTFAAWCTMAVMAVLATIYFSRPLRRVLGLHRLASRLRHDHPIRRLQQYADAYRHHLPALGVALLVSLGMHTAEISATALAGYALGMSSPPLLILTVLPVVLGAGTLPMTYQGLGVMEALAVGLLVGGGDATHNQVIAMLLFFRLYLIFYGLLGSLVLLRGDIHLHPREG
ncbi:MAG: flippase-like domain-containing protein [Phycisphaeraceae bacterium]|nr:flippase-like domain-containing protein [Phycisphaeraceae bacterium]